MESAGIPDLSTNKGLVLAQGVRLSADHLGNGAADGNTGQVGRVNQSRGLAPDERIDVESTASHHLEVRIDKFTNHDLLQRVCVWSVFVNNTGSKRTSAS